VTDAQWCSPRDTIYELAGDDDDGTLIDLTGFTVTEMPRMSVEELNSLCGCHDMAPETEAWLRGASYRTASFVARRTGIPLARFGMRSFLDARYRQRQRNRVKRKNRR